MATQLYRQRRLR